MNENASSGAGQGLKQNGAAEEAAAPRPSAASALLSAAAIWSTGDVVMPAAETIAVCEPEPIKEPEAQPVDIQEAKPAIEAPPSRKLRPSELLAEARFFNSYDKRTQQGPPAPATGATAVEYPERPKPVPRCRAGRRNCRWRYRAAARLAPSPGACWSGCSEEPACDFDAISGASVGAINAALLACGPGRRRPRGAHAAADAILAADDAAKPRSAR